MIFPGSWTEVSPCRVLNFKPDSHSEPSGLRRAKGEEFDMITCERCNTENLEGSQYCDECGAALALGSSRPKKPTTGPTEDEETPDNVGFIVPVADNHDAGLRADGTEVFSERHSEVALPAARTSAHIAHAPDNNANSPEIFQVGQNGPHAKLVIHRGRSAGKEFVLNEDESHIGRWDADGGIFPDVDLDSDDPEAKVSRRHARITRRSEKYYIEDLGSTNGTFINRGRRLLPGDRQPLRDGDEVIVGKTFLRFHVINK